MNKYQLGTQTQRVSVQINGDKQRVDLHQIIALRDFSDVKAGTPGGWIASESCLSQQGECWIYAENSVVLDGAIIEGNARVTGECLIGSGVRISDNAWIDNAELSHGACISGNATVQSSLIRGVCSVRDEARVINQSEIYAAQGMTPDSTQTLQIYQHATVNRSRVVHQAQLYGRAMAINAFIEHRAEVFDDAMLQGNEENSVWLCDCAKVYGSARIVAGSEEDQCPAIRYSSQVYGNALIEGDCVLKHHVQVYGDAVLRGGPVQLDNHVTIHGQAQLSGNVLIENHVEVCENAIVEGSASEAIHIRDQKAINGEQHITRTPFYGVF